MGRNPALFRSLPLPSLSGWEFNCYHLYLQEVHREGLMRKLCVYILVAITVKQETPPYLTLSRTMCMCTYMFPFYLWFTLALGMHVFIKQGCGAPSCFWHWVDKEGLGWCNGQAVDV